MIPADDPNGNLVRAVILALMCIIGSLSVVFVDPGVRLDPYSNLVNLFLACIPIIGASYAFFHLNGQRNDSSGSVEGRGAVLLLKRWNKFLKGRPYARALFWFATGLLGWGIAIVCQTFLQNFVTHDQLHAPPSWMGNDLFFLLLPFGWLLGLRALFHACGVSLRGAFLRSKKVSSAFILGNAVLMAGLLPLAIRAWCRCSLTVGPLDYGIVLLYGLLDGAVLAAVLLLPRGLDLNGRAQPGLHMGLRVMGAGWGLLVLADQMYVVAYGFPSNSPLHYYVGSFFDILYMLSLAFLVHGLVFAVYAILVGRPHISFLSEQHRQLTRLLVEGNTIKELAATFGVSTATVERRITELYRATGFDSADRFNKRTDFVAYYRAQVTAYFHVREGLIHRTYVQTEKLPGSPAQIEV